MLTVLLFCASVSSVHLHPFTYFHFFSFHKFTYFFTYLFHTLFLLSSPSLSFIAVNFISIVLLPPSRYLIIYLLQFIYFYPCRFVYSTSVCMYVCMCICTHARTHARMSAHIFSHFRFGFPSRCFVFLHLFRTRLYCRVSLITEYPAV